MAILPGGFFFFVNKNHVAILEGRKNSFRQRSYLRVPAGVKVNKFNNLFKFLLRIKGKN